MATTSITFPLPRRAQAGWGNLTSLRRAAPLGSLLILGLLVLAPLLTMLVASLRPAGTCPLGGCDSVTGAGGALGADVVQAVASSANAPAARIR